jgi:hypothetical protein
MSVHHAATGTLQIVQVKLLAVAGHGHQIVVGREEAHVQHFVIGANQLAVAHQ